MDSLVSIIIPCYNQDQFLKETLHSVLSQNYPNWECLIINDGSTDDTAAIGSNWQENDARFKYYYKENGGLSSARNYGLYFAKGEFIQLLDSDDLIDPKKLEIQVEQLQNNDASICDYIPFDHETGEFKSTRYLSPFLSVKYYKKEIIQDWEYRKSIPCHTVLFKKSIVDRHGIRFNEELDNHEDWVFWVQLFYHSDSIINIQQPLASYRIHSDSMSSDYWTMKTGFLKAANTLEHYYRENNDPKFAKIARIKFREISRKNHEGLVVKVFKRIKRRLSLYFNHAQ